MQYIYFVAYAHERGVGNIEITQDMEMTEFSYIQSIEKMIEDRGSKSPIVTGFHLLRKEPNNGR